MDAQDEFPAKFGVVIRQQRKRLDRMRIIVFFFLCQDPCGD